MSLIDFFPCPQVRRDQIGCQGNDDFHGGYDIFGDNGFWVCAEVDHQIIRIGEIPVGGYRIGGLTEDNLYYYYAHLEVNSIGVAIGQYVHAGDIMAKMDSTGEARMTSPHLHNGIFNGVNWIEFWNDLIEAYNRLRPRRVKPMIEHGRRIDTNWWKAGWFTGVDDLGAFILDHCVLVITASMFNKEAMSVGVFVEKDGIFYPVRPIPNIKPRQTVLLDNSTIPGVAGMLWVETKGGELADLTIRTVLRQR